MLQGSTCHGKKWSGRCVTQLTLGHGEVDGYEPEATGASSELGEDAVREEEEEDSVVEVEPEAMWLRAWRQGMVRYLAFPSTVFKGVGGAAMSYSELELKLGRSMVGRATAWRG